LLTSFVNWSQTTVLIPDDVFEAYLEAEFSANITSDGSTTDGSITFTDINLITIIDLPTAGVTTVVDLTGVKEFPELVTLTCNSNMLSGTLDISGLAKLTQVRCYENANLTGINLTGCSRLNLFYGYYSGLVNVDLSASTLGATNKLKTVYMQGLADNSSDLTTLNITGQTNIRKLDAFSNPNLTSLDIAPGNTLLTQLRFQNSNITGDLDVSANLGLQKLGAYGNNLTSIVLGETPYTSFTYFKISSNDNLTCVFTDNPSDFESGGPLDTALGSNYSVSSNTGFVTDTAGCDILLNFVTDGTNLQNLVNAASPGEIFTVANGTYNDFYSSFTAIATEENPITIKAESIDGVTLTGDSRFVFKKAAHLIFEGFVFNSTGDNTLVKLEGSNNIHITRNVFELTTTSSIDWLVITGYYDDPTFQFMSHHNKIDYNIFQNKDTTGNYITIGGTYNTGDNRQSQYDIISYNYFYNNAPRFENEKESIRIGDSQLSTSSGFTTVEFNLFEECDGDPEIVSVKSCDNNIKHNTFTKSYGTLTLRQGNRTRVEGNYFFGGNKANGDLNGQTLYTGGIRAYGTDHVIINNYLEGLQGTRFDAPITLTQGDAIDGVDTDFSLHFRGERITIAFNTLVNNVYGIEIGYAKQNGSYDIPLKDITIANNLVTGSENSLVTTYNDQGGEIIWINNIMNPTGSAQLTNDGATFTSDEVLEQDPYLTFDGIVWRSTSSSPTIADGVPALTVDEDIEGQTRPSTSNAGADHYSLESIRYAPLTTFDVGPEASENTLSVYTPDTPTVGIILYPNPTTDIFRIKTGRQQLKTIRISSNTGQTMLLIKDNFDDPINISKLSSGLYIVEVFTETERFVQKLIVK